MHCAERTQRRPQALGGWGAWATAGKLKGAALPAPPGLARELSFPAAWEIGHPQLGGLPAPSGTVPRRSLSPSSGTFGKALLASVTEPRQSHPGPPGPLGAAGSTQSCPWKGRPVGPFMRQATTLFLALRACSKINSSLSCHCCSRSQRPRLSTLSCLSRGADTRCAGRRVAR